ncbi:MAG: class I mannose-6-phosphate isomerase [Anaerolineae bacterium]|nr:class I mannose-6-phosphate isomerase [Candidatus Roseilinea sp.]MDW8448458.1 class I mannose-6-phosphate isomerase [Anaerolineae bacterium]
MAELLRLLPEYHHRVWGGRRLKPDADQPIGEAWIVYEHNRIADGRHAGRTLAELAGELGAALLGEAVVAHTGTRFPLLIKLLDCNDWLSIQVHPNDAQAIALEGPGHFGKTEAWYVLEASAGAQLIAGVKPGVEPDALQRAIRDGSVRELVQHLAVRAGDTIFMPAGTLHALGPGLLIYEVQQTSDITYRVWDWNRPASAGRALHIEQSLAVTDPSATGQVRHLRPMLDTDAQQLVACPYFTLDLLASQAETLALDTRGQSFHALTVIAGRVVVESGDASVTLDRFESVIVPAANRWYQVRPLAPARVLKASAQ